MNRVITSLILLGVSVCGHGDILDDGRWTMLTSIHTAHFSPRPEHNNSQALLGFEYHRDDEWIVGGVTFRNSFNQPSRYAYAGRRFDHHGMPVYAKLTGGMIHGYRGEYQDKIPLNQLGIAPVLIPAVGVQAGRYQSELVLLGAAAAMINLGVQF